MSKLAKVEPKQVAATPAALLQIAMEQNADLDKLEKLMELQERWDAAEAKKAFVKSLSNFQSDGIVILKNKKAHNSNYATLSHTLETIADHMRDCGLSHSWKTDQMENGLITVTCCVTHIQRHQECTSLSASSDTSGSKNSIQALGSTVSYLQRYTLYSILGLSSKDSDDDGAAAVKKISQNDVLNLQALIEDVKADYGKFLQYMRVNSLEEISLKDLAKATNSLESKRK